MNHRAGGSFRGLRLLYLIFKGGDWLYGVSRYESLSLSMLLRAVFLPGCLILTEFSSSLSDFLERLFKLQGLA